MNIDGCVIILTVLQLAEPSSSALTISRFFAHNEPLELPEWRSVISAY